MLSSSYVGLIIAKNIVKRNNQLRELILFSVEATKKDKTENIFLYRLLLRRRFRHTVCVLLF